MSMEGCNELRIVLIGKSGCGKSSTGNTIIQMDKFLVRSGPHSTRLGCVAKESNIDGTLIKVFDTPGLNSLSEYSKDLQQYGPEFLTEVSPGPHAFVLVLKVERFTHPEKEIVKQLARSNYVNFAVILFTHGEALEKGKTIEDFVGESEELTLLMKRCGNRCHVIDNKYWNQDGDEYRCNRLQVAKLLDTIREMSNKMGCYTDDPMLQDVEKRIKHEKDIFKNEYGYTDTEARDRAKREVLKCLQKDTAAVRKLLVAVPVTVALAALGAVFYLKK